MPSEEGGDDEDDDDDRRNEYDDRRSRYNGTALDFADELDAFVAKRQSFISFRHDPALAALEGRLRPEAD